MAEEVDGVAEVDGVGAGAAGGAGVGAVAAGAAVLMQIRAEWNTLFLLIVAGLQQILKRHMELIGVWVLVRLCKTLSLALLRIFWWSYCTDWIPKSECV